MRTRIKFCGCTTVQDARLAVECGVDAIGVIFARESPRCVSLQLACQIADAIAPFVSLVGVFVEPEKREVEAALEIGYKPQFSGSEPEQFCEAFGAGSYIKVFHVPPDLPPATTGAAFADAMLDYPRATWMFDTSVDGKRGGTGRTFDWTCVRELSGDPSIIISGGLVPANVGACIRLVRPYAVDVRSGIETNGVKDPAKMRAFVRAVKEADEQA